MKNDKMMEKFDENWMPVYQSYSREGIFKGEVKFDFGQYKPRDLHCKKFFKDKLIGIFERKDTDDIVVELIKTRLK